MTSFSLLKSILSSLIYLLMKSSRTGNVLRKPFLFAEVNSPFLLIIKKFVNRVKIICGFFKLTLADVPFVVPPYPSSVALVLFRLISLVLDVK